MTPVQLQTSGPCQYRKLRRWCSPRRRKGPQGKVGLEIQIRPNRGSNLLPASRLSMHFLRIARQSSCNNRRRFVHISAISKHHKPSVSSPASRPATPRSYFPSLQRNPGGGPDLKSFMPAKVIPPRRGIPNVTRVVAISSAKGGVGKSTVAGTQLPPLCSVLHTNLYLSDVYAPRSQSCHVPRLAYHPPARRYSRLRHLRTLNTKAHGS